jgi:pyridoxamine--pyruvate transaminase
MGKEIKFPEFSLTAGPTNVSPEVQRALSQQMMYFDDPYFEDIFEKVTEKMKQILLTKNDVVIMQGEAVLGLEAAAQNCISPGDRCLNLVSGVYGKGFEWYISANGGETVEIRVDYNDIVDPDMVEKMLKKEKNLRFLSVVHSETPSGTLNPIKDICRLAKQYGLITIVDSVSAAGGTELRVDDWGVDICVVGPQKCLSSSPGLSILSVSDQAWDVMKKKNPPRYSFLSILDWKEIWLEKKVFPYTPSVADMFALHAAVDVLLAEGLENAWKRHNYVATLCRAGVKGMGLELWPKSAKICNNCCTAIRMPEGIQDKKFRLYLREKYGVMISGGYGELIGQLFRISHMGHTAKPHYVLMALALVERTLYELGYPVKLGGGVTAALEAM